MKTILFSTSTLTAMALAATAHAQGPQPVQAAGQPPMTNPAPTGSAQEAAGAPVAASNGAALQEIVVTAQRRSENLQKVPIAVTSISAAELKSSGVANLAQINTLVSGLTLRQSDGDVQTSIRGVGTSIGGGENTAAIYIDDVYLPLQRDGLRELPDVSQISVLKGPQGTLFGRNATAGVIQITTLQPTQDFHYAGDVSYGDYNTVTAEGFVSGGLAHDLAGSLAFQYDDQGQGYGRNLLTGNGANQLLYSYSARAKLLFTPDNNTKITLEADYLDRSADLHSLHPTPGTSFVFPMEATSDNPRDYASQIDSKFKLQSGGLSLKVEHTFDFATFRSISAYRQSDASTGFDALPTGFPVVYVNEPYAPSNSFSQELQLISRPIPSLPISWSAGLYYFHANDAELPTAISIFPGNPPAVEEDTYAREITNSAAAYAQVDVKLPAATTLTMGGRYTYEKRDIFGLINTDVNGQDIPGAPLAQSITASKPTWRFALNHQITNSVMVYASYNRGFKSGGFNLQNPDQAGYLPEKLDAYETGIKSEFFDRKVRLNLSGYYYDYSNIQVTEFKIVQFTTNGAKAQIYGADADLQARVTPRLTLTGDASIISPTFTAFPNAQGATPLPTGGVRTYVFDASGKQLPGAQRFTGTLMANYRLPIKPGAIDVNVLGNFNSKYYFEPDNLIHQNPYILLNISARWTSSDSHYYIMLWGRNLTNRLITTGGATLSVPGIAAASGSLVAYEAPPRTYGFTAGVKF